MDLRYYQKAAIDNFFSFAGNTENHGKNPLIVLPTGSGKSIVSAIITQRVYAYPKTRILNLTHTKDIIQQNYNELFDNIEDQFSIDAGIYSAGLKRRDVEHRVIFAGIQSVHKKALHLGKFDLIIIDEAHRVPQEAEGTYRKFLDDMYEINPNLLVCGLTATPFRLKGGLLIEGKDSIFQEICHETTMRELMDADDYRNLDHKQYLSPLISPKKAMKSKVNLTNVHSRIGEYVTSELANAFMQDNLVVQAVKETIEYVESYNRKKILVFCVDIEHCEEVYKAFQSFGQTVEIVHSKRTEMENDISKANFMKGDAKYCLNIDSMTTGFNYRPIDCIVLFRSTQSAGLLIQIVGRGTRIADDKENCLLLDFGLNLERFGPIDKITVKKKQGGGCEFGGMPEKECPDCHSLMAISIMTCPDCGHEFPQKPPHEEKATEINAMSEYKPPEEYPVVSVQYSKHEREGKTPSLRVDYYIDIYQKFSVWVCIDHEGFAKRKALQWLQNVTVDEIESVDDALKYCDYFRKPSSIIVDENNEYPNILGYLFEQEMPPSQKAIEREAAAIKKAEQDAHIESLMGW